MARGNKNILTVLIVRGAGRSTLSLGIPTFSRARSSALALLAISMIAGVGFTLQRAHAPRPHVLVTAGMQSGPPRFSMFELIKPRHTEATAEQLLRRGFLMHAIKLGLGTHRAASILYSGIMLPEWKADAEMGPPGDGTLLWPVRDGLYTRGYGSGENNYHLAIDIMGTRGTSVMAAAPGIVAYAANTLRGYGNAIILVHPGGLITLYAHNQRNDVVPGQRVHRGQRIAALGSTGISMGPHVHFEFLHGGRNCDPLPLFRPDVKARPGHVRAFERAVWLPNQPRPETVRCDVRRHYPHPRGDIEEGEPIASAPAP